MVSEFYTYIYYRADGITPFYVGKGTYKRAYAFTAHNPWVKNIYNKESIKVDLIKCVNETQAFELEKHWIAVFKSDGYILCNQTDGGDQPPSNSGKKHSKETKQKMSKASLGKLKSEETKQKMRKSKSEEHRKKLSKAHTGKKLTETHIKHIVKSNTGKKRSENAKLNMSKAQKGRPKSEEHKKKISETNKGKDNHQLGRHHSEKTREKMKLAWINRKNKLEKLND